MRVVHMRNGLVPRRTLTGEAAIFGVRREDVAAILERDARSFGKRGEKTSMEGTRTMEGTRMLIDLQARHGASELVVGLAFQTGSAATMFLQDYCLNQNKRCVLHRGSGKLKVYKCSDEKCGWEVKVSRHVDVNGQHTMRVSAVTDSHHDVCSSTGKPTQRQIQALPAFNAAVRGDRCIKRKALVAIVQGVEHVNIQARKSVLYRAKDEIVDDENGKWEDSFTRLPALLAELRDKNPDTVVHLDVDQHERFLRAFLAFGVNIRSQQALLPVLGFDGTHSKHRRYNGVILSLIGRDGNGQNVTLANALVHVENEANIMWFLRMCVQSGIRITDVALFCDRGKIIGAVDKLKCEEGWAIQLRFCTIHILRNIRAQFGIGGPVFENLVWKLQASEFEYEYRSTLSELQAKFGSEVVAYLQNINPIQWTVHANMSTYPSTWTAYPMPLFGWRSTNFVESDNSAMIGHGIRDATPLEAIREISKVEMARASQRDLQVKKWLDESRVLTPRAKILWEAEKARVGDYTVHRSTDSVYFVGRPGCSVMRRVDIDNASCSCLTFDQMRVACRHIVAALEFTGRPDRVIAAFHPGYMVASYAATFADKGIELAVSSNYSVNSSVKPSPYYRQPGRRQTRRIASSGESTKKSTYKCRSCGKTGHNQRTCRRHLDDPVEPNNMLTPVAVTLQQSPSSSSESVFVAAAPLQDTQRQSISFLLHELT